MLTQLGFGGAFGYCAGYAFKLVGKAAMFIVGTGFIVLQVKLQ